MNRCRQSRNLRFLGVVIGGLLTLSALVVIQWHKSDPPWRDRESFAVALHEALVTGETPVWHNEYSSPIIDAIDGWESHGPRRLYVRGWELRLESGWCRIPDDPSEDFRYVWARLDQTVPVIEYWITVCWEDPNAEDGLRYVRRPRRIVASPHSVGARLRWALGQRPSSLGAWCAGGVWMR